MQQSIENIIPEKWKNVVGHTWCILNDAWNRECVLEQRAEDLIIRLGDDDISTEEKETSEDKLLLTNK